MTAHIVLVDLITVILLPGSKQTQPAGAFLMGIAVMECIYIYKICRAVKKETSFRVPSCIMMIVLIVLLIWETAVTKFDCMHPVLYPSPENVFNVFRTQYDTIFINILSTMQLLLISIVIGVVLGVVLGVIVGWNTALGDVF